MKKISGNLEYDLAVAIERFEDKSPIAARLVAMINQNPKPLEMIHIFVGTIDALFTTIIELEKQNKKLTDALTHPLILDALKVDADKQKNIKKS